LQHNAGAVEVVIITLLRIWTVELCI